MGVKTARTKQARKEFKRSIKALDHCNLCKKKVNNLEEHLQTAHAFVCARCGKRTGTEQQWRQHMRDKHGINEKDALNEDRRSRIEKWTEQQEKQSPKAAAKASMNAEDEAEARPGGSFAQKCELCGAQVMLPVDLSAQGLTFRCALAGRQCAQAAAAPAQGSQTRMSQPAPQPQAALPPQAAPVSLMGGAALPSFSPQAAPVSLMGGAALPSFSFQAPVPMPPQAWPGFGGGTGGAAPASSIAMDMAVPDDDDDDL